MDERGRSVTNAALTFYRLATIVLVVGVLYFLRDVLLPFALAVLLTFVLTPMARRLERWGLPRVAAVVVVTVAVGMASLLCMLGLGGQVVRFTNELPKYRENVRAKLATARESFEPVLRRIQSSTEYVDRVVDEAAGREATPAGSQAAAPAPAAAGDEDKAVSPPAVQPSVARGKWLTTLAGWLGPVLSPFAMASIVAVFTIFMLVEREDLRNRVIVLLGVNRVPGTTQLLDEAVRRVSRYLRMQLAINVIYGVALAGISLAVGLPTALLWGVLGTILRFIPYFGPVLAAAIPLTVSIAVADGWTWTLALAGSILVLELVVNNLLEPWLYGSSIGVSPIGILVSAFFWAWLWGIPGLILATPLTAVITVLARHIPALGFQVTLLGDDPPLSAVDRLYQRLLAGDAHEAIRVAEALAVAEPDPVASCEALLTVAHRAARDFASGAIDRRQMGDFVDTLTEVVEDLADELRPNQAAATGLASGRIVCLPARGPANAEAAEITALALSHLGWNALAERGRRLANEQVQAAAGPDVLAAVIVSTGARPSAHARYVLHRYRAAGGGNALVFLGDDPATGSDVMADLRRHGAVEVVSDLNALDAALRGRLSIDAASLAREAIEVHSAASGEVGAVV